MFRFVKKDDSMNNEIESLLRERINRAAFTHATHEEDADNLNLWVGVLKWVQIVLSAAITCEVFAVIFKDEDWLKIVAVLSSFVLTSVTMITKNLNLEAKAEQHALYAAKYMNVKDSLVSLLADAKGTSLSDKEIVDRRDEIQRMYNELNEHAPRTSSRAYKKAEKSIKDGVRTANDSVTDLFLPEQLRKLS